MKKLSIAINSRDNYFKTINLISDIFESRDLNIEVLLIDFSRDNTADLLFTNFEQEIKQKKLRVFSSYKYSLKNFWDLTLKNMTGDYLFFLSSNEIIKKNTIEKILHYVNAINPDILEFKCEFSHLKLKNSWDQKILKWNELYNVKNNQRIYAFTSPFIVNKIFKTSFIKKNYSLLQFDESFHLFNNYVLLSMARKYYFVSSSMLKFDILSIVNNHNLLFPQLEMKLLMNYFTHFIQDWEIVKKYIEFALAIYFYRFYSPLIDLQSTNQFAKDNLKRLYLENLLTFFPDFYSNKQLVNLPEFKKHYLTKEIIKNSKG